MNTPGAKTFQIVRMIQILFILILSPLFLFPPIPQIWFLISIPLFFLLHRLAWRRFLPVTPLSIPLLLLGIMLLVSLWSTTDLIVSMPKITGILFGLIVFWTAAEFGTSQAYFQSSHRLFCLVGLGITLVSLIGTRWAEDKYPILNVITSQIPFFTLAISGAEKGFHPTEVAGALLWVLPVTTGALFAVTIPKSSRSKSCTQWIWGVIFLASLLIEIGVLIMARSRIALLSFSVSCVVMIFLAIPSRYRKFFLPFSLVIFLLLLVLILSPHGQTIISGLLDPVQWKGEGINLLTANGRTQIWARAISCLQDFPITGLGLNRFRSLMYLFYPALVAPDLGHAHNELFQAGLDLGLPGMIAFIAINLSALVMLFQLYWHANTKGKTVTELSWIVIGLFGGLFSHFLFGLVDAVSLGAKPGLLFWLLLGLTAGLYQQVFSPEAGE